ncbi:hypothetical protein ACTXL6_17950 [Brachybacterium tyrofermentans]|uniref:hypothetical protein n=1 Tax=Brachybacterium tyrofermentans TaxID=47848 RepID=UPI003FD3E2D0
MTSTSDKKLARAIVDRHDGVKYTEALRFVARLKEMRERNESRAAFGVSPVIEVDPKRSDWELEETRRFFGHPVPAQVEILRGGHGRLDPFAFARDESTLSDLTSSMLSRSGVRALDEAYVLATSQRDDRLDRSMGRSAPEKISLDDKWTVPRGSETFLAWFEGVQRAARVASGQDRDAVRLQKRKEHPIQSPEDSNPILGRPGAEKKSHFLKLQLEMEKRGQSTYVMDSRAGELPDTSDRDSEV